MSQDFPHDRRRPRFPGIVQDAQALGVTREHLWRVLMGERESIPLLKRYNALKAKQRKHERAAQ